MSNPRIERVDRIRGLLMALVVLGHVCETVTFPDRVALYQVIYSLHMPAFVFLTGMCSRPDHPRNTARRYLYPYLLCQLLYFLLQRFALGQEVSLQFTTPIWVLWYLLCLWYWRCALCLVAGLPRWGQRTVLALSVAAALAAGWFKDLGMYLSLSRAVVFWPFFLAGWLLRPRVQAEPVPACRWPLRLVGAAMLALQALLVVRLSPWLQSRWFYGSQSYEAAQYGVFIRLAILVGAAWGTGGLWLLFRGPGLRPLGALGRRTLPVYLLHAPVILWLKTLQPAPEGFWLALGLSLVLTALPALEPVRQVVSLLLTPPWIGRSGAGERQAGT